MPEAFKSVLFTSMYFKGYAGSEIATLEQIGAFRRRGWDVCLFTLVAGDPLIGHLPKHVRVFTLENVNEMPKHFDLMISRQFPLLDYVLFTGGVKADRVYYEAVGYKIAWDAFPLYYNHLTLTGAVSDLTRRELSMHGFDTSKTYVYPNSAPAAFFQFDGPQKSELKKIAVVSNHMPSEIEEMKELAERDGCAVDLYGRSHRYELITPQVLGEYDAVVSIGKTVYYSLAMGIPAFMYDVNVSEGYVTLENFTTSLECNFARKDTYEKMAGDFLWKSIKKGYRNCTAEASLLRIKAKQNFNADVLLDNFLHTIEALPPMDYDALYRDWPTLHFTAGMYCEEFTRREHEYDSIDRYLKDEIARHFALMQDYAALEQKYEKLDHQSLYAFCRRLYGRSRRGD